MAELGLRPKGTGPGVLETVISGASKFMTSYTEAKEAELKKTKEKSDTYNSLRKSGYTRKQAYKALKEGITEAPEGDYQDLDRELKKSKIEKNRRAISDDDTPSKIKNKIKMKIYNKEQLNDDEYDFAAREGIDVPEDSVPIKASSPVKEKGQQKYNIDKAKNWGDVPFLQRVISAATPKATKTEERLGPLRPGGLFKPPKEKAVPKGISPDRINRARAYIKSKRGKTTDEEVYKFLQKYPDFK